MRGLLRRWLDAFSEQYKRLRRQLDEPRRVRWQKDEKAILYAVLGFIGVVGLLALLFFKVGDPKVRASILGPAAGIITLLAAWEVVQGFGSAVEAQEAAVAREAESED